MSFPNVIYMPDGEQFNTYTDQRFILGTQMILPDGRKFRFVKAGGSALVSGTLQQQAANVANHVGQSIEAATAVGATSIPVTIGATAITANEYADGYIDIDTTPGQGFTYKIASAHPAVASSGTFTVPLAPGNSVQVALTTSSKASITKSPWDSVIQMPTTYTEAAAGVAQAAIPASDFGWIQTAGNCNVLTNGTVTIAGPVVASGTTAGAVEAASTTIATTVTQPVVGFVRRVGATTTQSLIFLTLDQ